MTSSILIAGGGSAGWITANVLAASFERANVSMPQITVVESPDIPIIGVGEATVPSIRRTLQHIGLAEIEFMRACDATFKTLIRFNDWNPDGTFDHPFDRRTRPDTDNAVDCWLGQGERTDDFAPCFSILCGLADRNLAPKAVGWPDFGSPFPYAYHLDAVKLAQLLTRKGVERGVGHILATIEDVQVSESGDIEAVQLSDGSKQEADLFIDCTGFSARLIDQALKVPKVPYGRHLLCDRAVTLQVPYDVHQPERIKPYTVATARTSGWQWDINLQQRRGLGYVYSSAFLSAEAAEAELRAAEGVHTTGLAARHISFESHKRQRAWVGNCIAIGLAGGFLEPLESSGLYMVEFAAQALGELLPHTARAHAQAANRFNAAMDTLYTEVLEYLNLHYVTSSRRDTPFWRAATAPGTVPHGVQDKFELWRTKRPSELDFDTALRLFSIESYEYLLFGMRYTEGTVLKSSSTLPNLSESLAKCEARLPSHEEWLAKLA